MSSRRISHLVAIIFLTALTSAQTTTALTPNKVGLGKVLSGALGGEIFDFDVDQNGTDGILDDAATLPDGTLKSAIETFDISAGKITKVVKTVYSPTSDTELVTLGIRGADIGFVDEQRVHIGGGRVTRNDIFDLLNPASGNQITGTWTLPESKGALLWALAPNQSSSTQVAMVFRELNHNDIPFLYVTDLATNTIINTIKLPQFEDDYLLLLAQDSATNEAITNIDSAPGGPAPINVVINLTTGKSRQFSGFNNGFYGAGAINGLAVDSSTGILCTTTSLNSQVEFYKLSTGSGVWAQLPGTTDTDELDAGWQVTADSVHHLFLVGQPTSSTGGNSAIYVYDEKGNLKETINGFSFGNEFFAGALNIAINPNLRVGWVNGPSFNQLQQFFY
ncbi:MAG TPA: hypothetical protein VF753_15275 [Terriglobales bacterium]